MLRHNRQTRGPRAHMWPFICVLVAGTKKKKKQYYCRRSFLKTHERHALEI